MAGEPFDLDLAAAAAGLGEQEALAAIDDLLAANVAGADRRRRAATASATRSCAAPSTTAPARRGACRRTRAPPTRSPTGRARWPRARTTSSAPRASATRRPPRVLEQAGHQAAARAPAIAARWFEAALRLLGAPPGEAAPRLADGAVPASTPAAGSGCSSRWPARCAATGRLERALETLVEALALVDLPDLRVRLIAACAACENLLGRHDAAPRAAPARARGARGPGRRRGGRPARRAGRRRALRQRLRGACASGPRGPATPRRRCSDRGLEALATALLCFAEYNLGHAEAAEAGARARRRADRRAARRPAHDAARRAVLLRLRRVLLRALRRVDPPPAARHQPLARDRAGPVRGADEVGLAHALETRGRLAEAAETADAAVEAARLAGNRAARRLGAGRRRLDAPPRSATASARGRRATRRSRCSTGSTRAC